ncbi:MAG: hypothetical protein ACTSRJ_07055, partial [Candidatus Hodarchaeales archaeon]
MPVSLFPAVPFKGQIEILTSYIEALTAEQDFYRLSFINSVIQKFRERKYSEIFSNEYISKEIKQTYYDKSCFGMIHLSCSSGDVFSKENYNVLKFIKDKLDSSHLKWFFAVTSDNTLVFTLSYNQFLSWSTLLKSHSEEFICLSLTDPSILDLIDDEYKSKSYKKSLLILNQLYTSIDKKNIPEEANESYEQVLQKLLKFSEFETSHDCFKSYFESLLLKIDDI